MCKSAISTKDFLTTLYPEPFDGAFVEIRILSDQYQKCFGQHWFKSKEEIIDQFDELCAEGAKEHACVAFSPALRNDELATNEASRALGASGWTLIRPRIEPGLSASRGSWMTRSP